jgi:hypothetical protein
MHHGAHGAPYGFFNFTSKIKLELEPADDLSRQIVNRFLALPLGKLRRSDLRGEFV